MCVSDNGTELTGMAALRWSQELQIEWPYIAPGKPTQNAFIVAQPDKSWTFSKLETWWENNSV